MLGWEITVHPSNVEEEIRKGLSSEAIATQLATDKAVAVAASYPDALVLGADTIVVIDEEILGKPADGNEAREMLQRLSGRTHIVYTGIGLQHAASERTITAVEMTEVTFAPMTREEIEAYVATGSPLDKAGAYGIQDDGGALFVQRINGDYYTVVGLPLHRLYRTLRDRFDDLIDSGAPSYTSA